MLHKAVVRDFLVLSGGHLVHRKICSDFLSVMRGYLTQGIFSFAVCEGGVGKGVGK
jgi:hypothetical protein